MPLALCSFPASPRLASPHLIRRYVELMKQKKEVESDFHFQPKSNAVAGDAPPLRTLQARSAASAAPLWTADLSVSAQRELAPAGTVRMVSSAPVGPACGRHMSNRTRLVAL